MMKLLLPGLLLSAGVTLASCGGAGTTTRHEEAAPAPEVSWSWLDDSEDGATSLSAMRGRVVLLEFWRTW